MVKEAVFWEVEMDCEDAIALLGGIKVTRLHYIRAVPFCSQKSYPCSVLRKKEHYLFSGSQLWFFRQGKHFTDAWVSWPKTVIVETLLYFLSANGTHSTLWLQTNPWTSHCITWAIFRNFQLSPSTVRRASGLLSPKLPDCIATLAELLLILQII